MSAGKLTNSTAAAESGWNTSEAVFSLRRPVHKLLEWQAYHQQYTGWRQGHERRTTPSFIVHTGSRDLDSFLGSGASAHPLMLGAGVEPAFGYPEKDFKSFASTHFAIRAIMTALTDTAEQ